MHAAPSFRVAVSMFVTVNVRFVDLLIIRTFLMESHLH